MTDYTISSKISNEMVYACYRGRFWYWNGSIWKESRIMTHRFELARAADKNLTPQSFLTNGAEFAPLDEYEIDCAMLDALENAKPCKNAPIDPVEEDSSSSVPASCICSTCTCGGCKEECFGNCHSCGHPVQECNSYQTEGEKHLTPAHSADVDKPEVPGTQTTQNKPLTTIPDEIRPAFDYSGLDAQTVDDLHFAEDEYRHGKKLAERGLVHMGNAIAAAHDALCGVVQQLDNSKHGNRGDDSFRAWCCSIGITKSTAYNLLQVSALMDGSSPRQRAILEALPPTLLYAVAKPSAPAELVEQVKSGDITTHKQYQEALAQIKAEKERADAAEAERDKLLGAQNRAAWAESHIQDVEAQRDAALADVQGLTEQNAKLRAAANEVFDKRDARLASMTDESVSDYYTCIMCQAFSPSHVCIVTPERLGLCGAVSWLDAKATKELDPAGPCQPIPKEGCLDEHLGRYTSVDEAVSKYSHGALEHVTLYSLFQDPMTSCGCFECICGVEPVSMGVVITCREHAGMTPLGMTFSEMASMTGGGVQTPGFMGHGKHFIASKKFIAADGGPGRIVWLPKILKDQMRERLDKTALEMYGVENFTDMIADETICTEDPEQLLNFLSEVGHPVLSMEPFDM